MISSLDLANVYYGPEKHVEENDDRWKRFNWVMCWAKQSKGKKLSLLITCYDTESS